jgi:hypothetical protein
MLSQRQPPERRVSAGVPVIGPVASVSARQLDQRFRSSRCEAWYTISRCKVQNVLLECTFRRAARFQNHKVRRETEGSCGIQVAKQLVESAK